MRNESLSVWFWMLLNVVGNSYVVCFTSLHCQNVPPVQASPLSAVEFLTITLESARQVLSTMEFRLLASIIGAFAVMGARLLPKVRFTSAPLSLRSDNLRLLQQTANTRWGPSNKTAVIILALEHNETAVLPQRVSFPSTGRKLNLLITDWQCDASLTLADPGDEGAQWWRHHSTAADREENVEKHVGVPAHQNRTETADKILHSFKQIIEKHSELMRILMTSFEEQAELLESFLSM